MKKEKGLTYIERADARDIQYVLSILIDIRISVEHCASRQFDIVKMNPCIIKIVAVILGAAAFDHYFYTFITS